LIVELERQSTNRKFVFNQHFSEMEEEEEKLEKSTIRKIAVEILAGV
jgi:hypothetical protein